MPHCWYGKEEEMERLYGWRSKEYQETFEPGGGGICMLPDGHDGPHVWTDPRDITVSFSGTPKKE